MPSPADSSKGGGVTTARNLPWMSRIHPFMREAWWKVREGRTRNSFPRVVYPLSPQDEEELLSIFEGVPTVVPTGVPPANRLDSERLVGFWLTLAERSSPQFCAETVHLFEAEDGSIKFSAGIAGNGGAHA